MRRKPDRLVPLERDICVAAFHLSSRGIDEFHGYQLANILKVGESHRLLTAYGTAVIAAALWVADVAQVEPPDLPEGVQAIAYPPPPPPRRGQSRR